MHRLAVLAVVFLLLTFEPDATCSSAEPSWQAGVARIVITPPEPMWLSGYGGRDHASEGKIHDLYARVSAIRDPEGKTAIFISTDLVGVPIKMVNAVSGIVEHKHGLPRRSLMFTCSHTHCGPALDHTLSYMLDMKEADWAQVRTYQQWLNERIVEVIDAALKDLQPAMLDTGSGRTTFAANRRSPKGLGPYDHQVPILRIRTLDGSKLRGLIFGYACHNTTLGVYEWCGDYAGFAQLYLEDRHPGAIAMFFTGGGADQNPLPRRTVELAQKYGRMLGTSVDDILRGGNLKPVTGSLQTSFRDIDLEFSSLPTRTELDQTLQAGDRYQKARARNLISQWDEHGRLLPTYPYPVQVWKLGSEITWVALGGELVVDYQIRLKNELGVDRTWVTGYANDVMSYIPSERVLEEGGYEADSSMIYYQFPSKWKPGLEDKIVQAVHDLAD
jgi:neutral ceramidase